MLSFRDGRLVDADGAQVTWPALAVLGDPVAHSLSPRLHAAALAARGLPHRYEAIEVNADVLDVALDTAREQGTIGLNLTLPHKESALALCGYVSDEAREIGAVNTLVRRRDVWHGHNTDARGLALALQTWRGRALGRSLSHAVVIGAGGAARAAVVCVRGLGVRRVTVAARTPARAAWAEDAGAAVVALEAAPLASCSIVLQCTPLGLDPVADPSPVDLSALATDAIAVDLTYADRPSAFLRQASTRGVPCIDGRPMLVAQAALAFSMWFGAQPPMEAMHAALDV